MKSLFPRDLRPGLTTARLTPATYLRRFRPQRSDEEALALLPLASARKVYRILFSLNRQHGPVSASRFEADGYLRSKRTLAFATRVSAFGPKRTLRCRTA